jgi:hypothetical protein
VNNTMNIQLRKTMEVVSFNGCLHLNYYNVCCAYLGLGVIPCWCMYSNTWVGISYSTSLRKASTPWRKNLNKTWMRSNVKTNLRTTRTFGTERTVQYLWPLAHWQSFSGDLIYNRDISGVIYPQAASRTNRYRRRA